MITSTANQQVKLLVQLNKKENSGTSGVYSL